MKMKFIYLFCLLFPFIFNDLFDKTIDVGLFQKDDEQFMFLRVGQPPQFFRVKVDTTSYHLWLPNATVSSSAQSIYDPRRSSTVEDLKSSIVTTKEKGNEVMDIIYLKDEAVSRDLKFNFVLLNALENDYTADGILGLGKKYEGKINYSSRREINANPRFSLIEYLYTNKIISSKVFSIRYEDNNRAKLSLGTIGESKTPISYCSGDESRKENLSYNLWNCPAKGIKFENGTYVAQFDENKKKMAIFDSSIDHISFDSALVKNLFIAIMQMTNGKCQELAVDNGIGLFCGNDLNLKNIPNFILQLDEISLKIPGKELFKTYYLKRRRKEEYGYLCKIIGIRNKDIINIGVPLMKYYHMVFDMEKERVGFGDYIDVFLPASQANQRRPFMPGRWRRRGLNISFYLLILVLIAIAIAVVYYYLKKRNQVKKVKGYHKKERLVEPIGTPMITISSN